MTLTEFLMARIAEDEAAARNSQGAEWSTGGSRMLPQPESGWVLVEPRHVLAECEARRLIVEQCQESEVYGPGAAYLCRHVPELLALPYADHPEYREEWRP